MYLDLYTQIGYDTKKALVIKYEYVYMYMEPLKISHWDTTDHFNILFVGFTICRKLRGFIIGFFLAER